MRNHFERPLMYVNCRGEFRWTFHQLQSLSFAEIQWRNRAMKYALAVILGTRGSTRVTVPLDPGQSMRNTRCGETVDTPLLTPIYLE